MTFKSSTKTIHPPLISLPSISILGSGFSFTFFYGFTMMPTTNKQKLSHSYTLRLNFAKEQSVTEFLFSSLV